MTEWKEYKLADVCTKIGSGSTPRGGGDTYLDSGEFALIRSQNVLDFSFSYNGLAYISEEQAQKLNNVSLEEGDVLLNITGDSVARVCQVPTELLPARVNQHVAIIRPDNEIINPKFLKYFLLNPSFKEYMLMLSSSGATRNAITKGMIENFTITAPNHSTQTAIAEILSSLDDKIELNNQINKDLEALAQALFKQWFIDFEFPNENGEPYRSSGGEMVDSELGEIPKGWKVDLLNTLFDFLEGPGLRNWQYTNEGMPFINIRLIQNGDINTEKSSFISKQEFETKYRHFELYEFDFVVSTSGTLGKSAIVRKKHLPLMLNTSVIRFKPLKQNSKCYMYQYLQSESFLEELRTQASGSVQLNFGPMHLNRINMIIPADSVIENYEEIFDNVYQKIISNREENNSLSTLRDTLLPKLISGELELSDIQTKTL